ncbi:MAG TPA: S41 family peptidase [Pyrinomonadaceae bacterium]
MGRRRQAGLLFGVLLIALSAAAGGEIGRRLRAHATVAAPRGGEPDAAIERDYTEALGFVTDNYADEIDYEKANQAAIQGMLSTLDPHSTFFPPADFARLKQDQDSQFYGIGVTILRHHDGVYVQAPVADTPAARAGLRYGDKIIEVDGKDASEWTSEQVSKAVRGDRGTPVLLKMERAGSPVPLYFTIRRDTVPLPSIRSAYMINPAAGTGYVALTGGFTHTTSDELQAALERLQKAGLRQLVLDLRNNPGGLLDQAIEVASQFLPRGATIVSVRGRGEYAQTKTYKNTDFDPADFPLVVLVNRNTASASEIVAGAIQDHGRGLLVGETSFGKGLVQRVFELRPWGAGLTLTTQKYYTPYGRSIQRDYSSGSLYDYYVRHSPEDEPAPQTPPAPSVPATRQPADAMPTPQPTPPKSAGPAVKTAGGRVFYGGGGITPDIEVKPLDVTTPPRVRVFDAAFAFTRELVAGQISGLESYRVERVQTDRDARPTDYPVTDRVFEAFQAYVQRHPDLGLTAAQVKAEADYARIRLREEVLTAAFGTEAGARALLDSDPQLLRALEAFADARHLVETIRSGGEVSRKLNTEAPPARGLFDDDWFLDCVLA